MLALVLGAGLLCPNVGRAQTQESTAEALFRAGRMATQQGDHATACERFAESYRIEQAMGTLLNLSLCRVQLGQLSEAWRHLQQLLHALPPDDSRVQLAREAMTALDARLPRVTLVAAPGTPPEMSVTLNNGIVVRGTGFGVPFPSDPGELSLQVAAPGHALAEQRVQLHEGQHVRLQVAPGAPLPDPSPPSSPVPRLDPAAAQVPERSSGLSQRDLAFGFFGLSVAGVSLAATAGALLLHERGTVAAHCDADRRCDTAGTAAARRGDVYFYALVGTLCVAAGAGTAATYLWLSDTAQESPELAGVVPELGPDRFGASVWGAF